MRIVVKADFSGAAKRFVDIAARAQDVPKILKRWGAWLRADSREHFDAQPGWAPLAEGTTNRLKATRTSKITAAGNVRASYERAAARQIRGQLRKGVVNSGTQLAELRRLARGGSTAYSLQDGQRRQSSALNSLRRGLAKAATGKRVGGDKRAADKHRLLGKLRSSIYAAARGASVVVESRVPWSKIHNEGGTAGHGARIPARVFLEITQDAGRALADIALDHFLGGEDK